MKFLKYWLHGFITSPFIVLILHSELEESILWLILFAIFNLVFIFNNYRRQL